MEHRNEAVLEFLGARRSHPAKMLRAPAPGRDQVTALLNLAARVPDHGRMEPWRFVVLQSAWLQRMRPVLHRAVLDSGQDQAAADKAASAFDSPLVVAVISSPVDGGKIPQWEQVLSAGAVCLGLVNAALASGWGAVWLTGFAALNHDFGKAHLGLGGAERVAGMIHIGSRGNTPPERPRPDIAALTSWPE